MQCEQFNVSSPSKRFAFVRAEHFCYKCFDPRHGLLECSSGNCGTCNQPQHSLLHFVWKTDKKIKYAPSQKNNAENTEPPTKVQNCSAVVNSERNFILLPTAVVQFECANQCDFASIMFDSCSQPSVISDSLVKKYKL